MSIYRPAKHAQYNAKVAQALGETLEKIGFSATPSQIVDAARPANSPIHRLFEWDDTAAAEAFRHWQARFHTNHLLVVIKTDDGAQTTKAYHSVIIRTNDGDGSRAYCHTVNVAENPDLAQQAVAKALAELNGWKARYAEYRSLFSSVFRAIDDTADRARRRRKKRAKIKTS